jgi:hypothetical protein
MATNRVAASMPLPVVMTSSAAGGLHRRRAARRQTVALGIALVLAIGGCAASQPTWTKPGVTSADLRRDLVDCEREATGPPPFHFWALTMDYEAARDRIARRKRQCMQDRGWRLAGSNRPAQYAAALEAEPSELLKATHSPTPAHR